MTSYKILVACHKPSWVPKGEQYIPIHCGRKNSGLSKTELEWMYENTIGDDTGDNISHLNPYFCELTAIYWVWKNYDIIGNPEKIGLCHYRRYFLDIPTEADIVVPCYQLWANTTIYQQFIKSHAQHEIETTMQLIENPRFKVAFQRYLSQTRGHFYNMFLMEKRIFFEYCNLIFPLLFKQMIISNWHKNPDSYQRRMPGFIAERLTGAFVEMKKKEVNKYSETVAVIPWSPSEKMFDRQLNILRFATRLPGFMSVYSKFLSLQTYLNRVL